MGEKWDRIWEDIISAYHRKIAKDRANEEGIVVNPDGITNTPEEGDVLYTSDYGQTLIPYGTMEDEYHYYEIDNYINDINREYTQVLGSYDETGTLHEVYEYGNDRLSYTTPKETLYYAYDGQTSVSNLTNAEGQSVASYTYTPNGEVFTDDASNNPYNYNGEYTDHATKDQYLRARYYSPTTGNFLTQDTYLGEIEEPLSRNLYTYAENNPVNFNDPSGHGIFSSIKSGLKKAGSVIKSGVKKAVSTVKTSPFGV